MTDIIKLKGDLSKDLPPALENEPIETPDVEDVKKDETKVSRTNFKEKRTIIVKINRYRSLFKEELTDLEDDFKDLNAKTILQLENLLNDIQFNVESRRSMNSSRTLFLSGISLVEMTGSLAGLELHGMTQVCSQSPDLMKNVDEVALKYDYVAQIDPVVRLAMSVGQIALVVDASNRNKKRNIETTPEQETKFKDL